jgi:hypothetical protein
MWYNEDNIVIFVCDFFRDQLHWNSDIVIHLLLETVSKIILNSQFWNYKYYQVTGKLHFCDYQFTAVN